MFSSVVVEGGSPLRGEYDKLASEWAAARNGGSTLSDYRAADDALAAIKRFSWKLNLEKEFGGN